jgi:hypothetical protein
LSEIATDSFSGGRVKTDKSDDKSGVSLMSNLFDSLPENSLNLIDKTHESTTNLYSDTGWTLIF